MASGYKISGTDLTDIFEAQNYVTGYFYNNIVSNPYFNTPSITANSFSYITTLSTITNWTFSGTTSGTLITNGSNPWNNSTLPWDVASSPWTACAQALSIQFSALTSPTYTVSQNLSLATGTYIVSFYARPRPGSSVTQKLTCSLNGNSITTAFTINSGWKQYIFVTTSTTGTYPLSFVFTCPGSTGDTSISLTGITVTLNSVIITATGYTSTNFNLGGADLRSIFIPLPVSNSHTYSSLTGFKNSSAADLNTIFQWGGYTATVSYSSTSTSFNSNSFTVSGSYKYVTVNGVFYTSSSFTYSSTGLTPGTSYYYTIIPYNGLNISGTTTTTSSLTTTSLSAPTVTLTSIPGASSSSYTITFSYINGSFSYCNVNLYNSSGTYLSNLGTTSSSSSTSATFTTGTMTATDFYIKFVPTDGTNTGTPTATFSKSLKSNNTFSYAGSQTGTTFTLEAFTFHVTYLVIGGGGSGGSGGANGNGGQPNGGGGGGGGAGQIIISSINLTGTTSQQTGILTVGGGGSGVGGVTGTTDGHNGNNGTTSTLNFYNIITYTAVYGHYGGGGSGYDCGNNNTQAGGIKGLGGVSGSGDGSDGKDGNIGGAGGDGGQVGTYGNGAGGKGSTGVDGKYGTVSGTSTAGTVGYIGFTTYYFV